MKRLNLFLQKACKHSTTFLAIILFAMLHSIPFTAKAQKTPSNSTSTVTKTTFLANEPNKASEQASNIPKYNRDFFIENKGQWPSEVLFMTKQNGMNVWITKHGVTYDLFKYNYEENDETNTTDGNTKKVSSKEGHVIKLMLEGINNNTVLELEKKEEGEHNYILGNDKSKWETGVCLYKEAVLKDIYNGIDQKYYFDGSKVRYDYIAKAGSDVSAIKMKIEGSDKSFVNKEGELVLNTRFGEIKQAKLFTYQETDGRKVKVESKFASNHDGSFGFEVGNYDKNKPLIIDPIIWSTYLGGDIQDLGVDIAISQDLQFIYITGNTSSTNFPTTPGLYSQTNNGGQDGYVSKLTIDGQTLVASTYIGGNGFEEFMGIDINYSNNNICIVGSSGSTNYPTTVGPTFSGGTQDIVVTILDMNLDGPTNNLVYSRYWGGIGYDRGLGIQSNQSTDNSYFISGTTAYQNTGLFPNFNITTSTPLVGYKCAYVANVNLLNPSNSWVAYLFDITCTSVQNEQALDIELSTAGTPGLYAVGNTNAEFNFFNISGTNYELPGGLTDRNAFLVKFNPTTGGVLYSNVVGGSGTDQYTAIAVYEGFAYVTGQTGSNNLTLPINTFAGGTDILVSNFDIVGNLINNRYIGGSSVDFGHGITVDGTTVAICGRASSAGFNYINNVTQCPPSGSNTLGDAFIATLFSDLQSVTYSRFLGGGNYDDQAYEIIRYEDGYIIAGATSSPSIPTYQFPVTHNAYDITYSGGTYDAFITRITPTPINVTCTSSMPNVCPGFNTVLTGYGADVYSFNGSTPSANPFTTPNLTTTTTYTVVGFDALDLSCSASTTITINVGCDCPNAPSGATLLNNPSTISNSLANITAPIIVNGTFTVDAPTNIINNSNVYFLTGAKIDITGGGTLTVNNSTLDGCLVHWDGIKVGANNSISVSNQSNINHMINGIEAIDAGSVIQLENSSFSDNANTSVILINADFPTSGSFIENNAFKTSSVGLWAPFNINLYGRRGIYIDDCFEVHIGDITNAASGNRFIGLYNGIYANWGLNNTTSTIGIHNNYFANIKDFSLTGSLIENQKLNQAYNSPNGAGVYGTNTIYSLPGTFDLNITVDNTNAVNSPAIWFLDCDKGIAGNFCNLNANNLTMQGCLMGIMNNSWDNLYDIHNNIIRDAHLGVSLNNFYSSATIQDNDIRINTPVQYNILPDLYRVPIGIKINDNIISYPLMSNIFNNTIDIKAIAGIGIENIRGKTGQLISENTINFTTTQTVPSTGYETDFLYGIRNRYSEEFSLTENRVNGIDQTLYPAAFSARKSCGIFSENSNNGFVNCNKVKYTLYGFNTIGNCISSVHDNKCRNNVYPWMFDGLNNAVNSTFGDIGNSSFDNTNSFLFNGQSSLNATVGGVSNPNAYYIYRGFCIGSSDIYTNSSLLTTLQSGATTVNTEYDVTNISVLNTDPCLADPSFGLKGLSDYSEELIEYYKLVATSASPSGGDAIVLDWMNKLQLYRVLDEDEELRAYVAEFATFYANNSNGSIGKLVAIDKAISGYKTNYQTSAGGFVHYMEANIKNNAFISSLPYEQDLKLMNSMVLKTMKDGYEALTETEKETIATLAHSCVNQKGEAVLKARTMWNYFNPTELFDDRIICFNAQNKGGENDYDKYLTTQGLHNVILRNKDLISIYPNPASNSITLFSNEPIDGGEFYLYNLLGEKVFGYALTSNSNSFTIALPEHIISGLYTYQCRFNNHIETGKLTIHK